MNEGIIVHKFGGSCLRDASDAQRMAEAIFSFGGTPVVVVSALWGVTDKLIRATKDSRYAGRLVNDLRHQHLRFAPGMEEGQRVLFEGVMKGLANDLIRIARNQEDIQAHNRILAAGERLSALAVAHSLQNLGINALPVGAEDIGLVLDGEGRASSVDLNSSDLSIDIDQLDSLPILTGWFGEGKDGGLALLSRGGSDHSAAAFARLLGSESLILWKDVPGVLSLNPRWGLGQTISELSKGEAKEMALFGSTIIHPATMVPLQNTSIKIQIRSFSNPQSDYTEICDSKIREWPIAIACEPGVMSAEINTEGAGSVGNLISRFEAAAILAWSFESAPDSLRVVFNSHDLDEVESILLNRGIEYSINDSMTLLTLVGHGLSNHSEQWRTHLADLLNVDEDIELMGTSSDGVRFRISTNDPARIIAEIHNRIIDYPMI